MIKKVLAFYHWRCAVYNWNMWINTKEDHYCHMWARHNYKKHEYLGTNK